MVKYTAMVERRWKKWPGNNTFYCNGRLLTAKQVGVLVFLLVLIAVDAVLFFSFEYVLSIMLECPSVV